MLTQYLPKEGHLMIQTRYRVNNKSVKHYSQFGDALSAVSKMATKSYNVKLLIPYVEPLYIPVISGTTENTNKFKLGRKGLVGQNETYRYDNSPSSQAYFCPHFVLFSQFRFFFVPQSVLYS
jgi:hypothetical protein